MIRIKRALLMTTVSLICAITLCMQCNYAQAQELGEITPDMSFEFALVIAGQSAGSISSTAATPFDLTNVGIVSIGNQRLTAS